MLRDGATVRDDDEGTWGWTTSGPEERHREGPGTDGRHAVGQRAIDDDGDGRHAVGQHTIDDDGGWREVDRTLRGIAKRRAALDAEEARWLREAERVEIWKPLGMVNLMDYMERALGYAPRTAQKRLQVARALEVLPELTGALATGELPFSAVRELVRVATPTTEHAWRVHVDGMNLRQIEEAVAGRRPGDLPTDAPDDDAREHIITLRVTADAYATWRQGRIQLDEEHDHRLDDSELVAALFASSRTDGDREISGRAKFQISLAVCPRCNRGRQEGGGALVPVDAATVARAHCDAQHLGSLDAEAPGRAHQGIPPSIVRFVWRRDHGRCQVPGCRSARGIEIHHIEHREDGGSHDPSNLTLLCSACHAAHHRGLLEISGTAPLHIVMARLQMSSRDRGPTSVHVNASLDGVDHAPHVNRRPASGQVHVDANVDAANQVSNMNPDRALRGVHVDAVREHANDVSTTNEGRAPRGVHVDDGREDANGVSTTNAGRAPRGVHVDAVREDANGVSTTNAGRAPRGVHVDAGREDANGVSTTNAGRAPRGVHVDASPAVSRTGRFEQAVVRTQALDTLVAAGWKRAIARQAVDEAVLHVGARASLEAVVRDALRRCPRPRA